MKRLQARDQEERNNRAPQPAEQRGSKKKKKNTSRQPVYVRVAGDVYNLLHDGSIRTKLEAWQHDTKAREELLVYFASSSCVKKRASSDLL